MKELFAWLKRDWKVAAVLYLAIILVAWFIESWWPSIALIAVLAARGFYCGIKWKLSIAWLLIPTLLLEPVSLNADQCHVPRQKGSLLGVVVGTAVAAGAAVFLVWYVKRCRKMNAKPPPKPPPKPGEPDDDGTGTDANGNKTAFIGTCATGTCGRLADLDEPDATHVEISGAFGESRIFIRLMDSDELESAEEFPQTMRGLGLDLINGGIDQTIETDDIRVVEDGFSVLGGGRTAILQTSTDLEHWEEEFRMSGPEEMPFRVFTSGVRTTFWRSVTE